MIILVLVVNNQEIETISVKGNEFVQKFGRGVLLNVLAYPSLVLSNALSTQKVVQIQLSAKPYGKLEFLFDLVPFGTQEPYYLKTPLVGQSGSFQSLPQVYTVDELIRGIKIKNAKTILDIRTGNSTQSFSEMQRIVLINDPFDVQMLYNQSTNSIELRSTVSNNIHETSGAVHGAQLTMIVQK